MESQIPTSVANLAYSFDTINLGFNIDEYVRVVFYNEKSDIVQQYIQPVFCDNLYKDDNSWNQLRNISGSLICPNTTEIKTQNGNDEIGESYQFKIAVVSCAKA